MTFLYNFLSCLWFAPFFTLKLRAVVLSVETAGGGMGRGWQRDLFQTEKRESDEHQQQQKKNSKFSIKKPKKAAAKQVKTKIDNFKFSLSLARCFRWGGKIGCTERRAPAMMMTTTMILACGIMSRKRFVMNFKYGSLSHGLVLCIRTSAVTWL